MKESEQTEHFGEEIDRLVDRFRAEYEITYAAVVGVLVMKAHMLCIEAAGQEGRE